MPGGSLLSALDSSVGLSVHTDEPATTSPQVVFRHEPPSSLMCSARRCAARAEWVLRWNNPSLHTPERRKVWLACPDHVQGLSDFLRARGFLRETAPASEEETRLPS